MDAIPYKTIEKYVTADGKEFFREDAAVNHIEDLIYKQFSKSIDKATHNFTPHEVLLSLMEDRKAIFQALKDEYYGN
jgi:hypothetical protein